MFKRKLSPSDLFLLLANLIPLWGVWFNGWNAMEVFIVYCLETIIIGLYNLMRLWITTLVKKQDVWNSSGQNVTMMSGYFFMFFFLIHYGFFVAIQMSIFLSTSGAEKTYQLSNAWDLIAKFPSYLSSNSRLLLIAFVASYGIYFLKDFIFNGAYKTASLTVLMFEPYIRIIIQQFTVIVGGMFLGFGAGRIFITIFVIIKIYFDVFMNYGRMMNIMAKKEALAKSRQQ